jgi:hypothetical protein
MLSVVIMSVAFFNCYAECHYAESYYANCRGAYSKPDTVTDKSDHTNFVQCETLSSKLECLLPTPRNPY